MRFNVCAVVFFLSMLVPAFSQDAETFSVPELLKPNVEFWKKVYTDISLSEGVIHDRQYPLVMYRRMALGSISGKARSLLIDKEKSIATEMILRIVGDSALTEDDIRVKALLQTYVPRDAWDSAGTRLRFQQGQKERYISGLERSGAYIDTIRKVFRQYNIPERIIFLPHVESSFDITAGSKVGALGMWQFMRATGKIFGLKINYLIDERRDPYRATDAAARLLRDNYKDLGAWPLAITAYNHGVNGMKRAVTATGSKDFDVILKNYQSPSFQFASRNFYACFLAASEIALDPEKYFGKIAYEQPLPMKNMTLARPHSPGDLARQLGVSAQLLARYNPALRPQLFSQQKPIPEGFTIRYPESGFEQQIAVALHEATLPITPPAPKTEPVLAFTQAPSQQGRSASPEKAVDVKSVSLAPPKPPEAKLVLPSAPLVKAPVLLNEGVTVASANGKADSMVPQISVVRLPWDFVSPVNTAESLTVAAALAALKASSKKDTLSAFDPAEYDLDAIRWQDRSHVVIRVAIDETLGHIADWLGIPMARLRALNSTGRNSVISVGRHLVLPADSAAFAGFTLARKEYHLAIEEDFYTRFTVVDTRDTTIRRGQTVWDLCGVGTEDEIPLWLFKKYNRSIEIGRLTPGMLVVIPLVAEK